MSADCPTDRQADKPDAFPVGSEFMFDGIAGVRWKRLDNSIIMGDEMEKEPPVCSAVVIKVVASNDDDLPVGAIRKMPHYTFDGAVQDGHVTRP